MLCHVFWSQVEYKIVCFIDDQTFTSHNYTVVSVIQARSDFFFRVIRLSEKLGVQGQEKVLSAKTCCFESLRVQTYCRYPLLVLTELLIVKLVIMQKINCQYDNSCVKSIVVRI